MALMVKVWNEEFFLPFMLEYYDTLPVDAIYIFEGGSTDKTTDLLDIWVNDREAPQKRVVVYQEQTHDKWLEDRNEAKLINEAIEMIESRGYDWIVKLDADEVFTTQFTSATLSTIKDGRMLASGLNVPRYNLFEGMDKYVNYNKADGHWWYPDYNVRAFNVKRARWRHYGEGLDTQLQSAKMPIKLSGQSAIIHLHLVFPDRRNKRFATLDERIEEPHYEFILKDMDKKLIPDMLLEWYNSLDLSEVNAR